MKTSDFVTFSKLSSQERLEQISRCAHLTEEEKAILQDANALSMEKANSMIDNVIGRYALPLGCAVGIVVNGREYCVPMVFEEPSVVLGVSYGGICPALPAAYSPAIPAQIMIAQTC